MLSAETKAIIRSTVPILQSSGVAITGRFYQRLFEHHPELKGTFNMANQAGGRQQQALAGAVYAYAANIDDPSVLAPALHRIAHKHAALGVQRDQYPIVGKHLLGAIKDVLGDAATDEIIGAWTEAFGELADMLIAEEASMYAQSEAAPGGWSGWRDFVVARKQPESEHITSFYLRPADGGRVARFEPGQYLTVAVDVPGLGHRQIRHYTLSDAPNDRDYRISVKREAGGGDVPPGWVSNLLHDHVHEGDTIQLSPPHGDFRLDLSSTTPVVLLSAGVGLTPMISMLNTLVGSRSERRIVFVHGARDGRTHAMKRHLQSIAREQSNVRSIVFYSAASAEDVAGEDYDHAGRIDLDRIREAVLLPDADYYLCGPSGFMHDQSTALQALGVSPARIHQETFGPATS